MKRALAALACGLALLLAGCGTTTSKGSYEPLSSLSASGATATGTDPASGLRWVPAASLPPQARTVLGEIDQGGPFEYPGKDGSVFGNFEGILPKESRGYYREYTVDTPGASNRGTRRIIAGSAGELYWTADHYEHFERIKR